MSRPRLAGQNEEIRAGPQTSFRLNRLPVRPDRGEGQTHPRPVVDPYSKDPRITDWTDLSGPATDVPHRPVNSHRKTGPPRSTPYEAHTVAPEKQLEKPESLEKVISILRLLHSHLKWWLEESNVLQGQPLHPLKHALQIFTDTSKEGGGAHLSEHTASGTWSLPESKLHINYLELKVVFLALREFQDLCENNIVLVATDNTTEVRPSACPTVENPDLGPEKTGYSQSPTHSRPAESVSRQAIQARTYHSNDTSPPRGLLSNMQQVAPASDLFTTTLPGLAVGALSLPWEDLNP